MTRRIYAFLTAFCLLLALFPPAPAAAAAEGDLPSTLYIEPSAENGIPSRIALVKTASSSGGWGGWPWGGSGGSSSSNDYQLYLPGSADPEACFFSWDDGLTASDSEDTYASGALPIPQPGETRTFTFTKGSETKTFTVMGWQGSAAVKAIFIEIDESRGTIAAMNNDSDHETTCTGSIVIDGARQNLPKIKGRGNSSWMTAKTKKPYNFWLDKKAVLLGIDCAKTKKWTLLANCDEKSLLRNKLGYDMAHQMGIGQDSAEVDVWMNAQYLGTYLLTPKYDSFVTDNGFLIENDNYKEPPVEEGGDPSFDLEGLIGHGSAQQYYNYNRITVKKVGDTLLGEETVENLIAAGEKIRVYTQDVWDAIRSETGYNERGLYYADAIDMESWARMYLMQDFIKNYDFCGGSIFFRRDGQAETDKLYAGPLWDLDIGFGCPSNNSDLGVELLDGYGWFVRNVKDTKTSIFKVVGQHEDFMEEVRRQYNLNHEVFDNAEAHLEELAQQIDASARMNDKATAGESSPPTNISRQTVKQRGTEYEQTYIATNGWRDYVDNVKTFVHARALFFRNELTDAEPCEHDYQPTVTAPTCTEKGYTTYTCSKCGDHYVSDEVSALGHHYVTEVIAPTCTEQGYTTHICRVCGDRYMSDVTEKLPHDFKDGVCTVCGEKDPDYVPPPRFADVSEDAWYRDAVEWAAAAGITTGATETTFDPNGSCTRAQVLTFLYRAAGEPPAGSDIAPQNPFVDVKETAYYYNAVLWAVGQGITTGTGGSSFNPNGKCTRAQVVTFLYRTAGQPSAGSDIAPQNPFTDVKETAYYYSAVLWAVGEGITAGATETTFRPNGVCTRAQVVTFLYRAGAGEAPLH